MPNDFFLLGCLACSIGGIRARRGCEKNVVEARIMPKRYVSGCNVVKPLAALLFASNPSRRWDVLGSRKGHADCFRISHQAQAPSMVMFQNNINVVAPNRNTVVRKPMRSRSALMDVMSLDYSNLDLTPYVVLFNIAILAAGVRALGIISGLSQPDFYGELEGFETNSLSRQAGEWAVDDIVPTRSTDGRYEVATFAGGCFWGTELHFQRIPGVIATCVGYTQGRVEKPSYQTVCSGLTGHTEGIQLLYDPSVVSYSELCDKLLSTVDSSLLNRVGNDSGTQYRHGIYPHTDAQMKDALEAIAREQAVQGPKKVVTEVKPATIFWPAEKYHQRYLQKGGQSAEKNAREAVRCYG